MKNYYSGPDAIKNYLTPNGNMPTPLVELPASLNPFLASHNIHISAKLLSALPLANSKAIPAWHMLQAITPNKHTRLIEASSGNTAFSLGIMAQYFGLSHVSAVASPSVSKSKLSLLQLAGVSVTLVDDAICPNPNDPRGAIAVAENMAQKTNSINLNQYSNTNNPHAHETITGPELYDQIGSNIGMLCAGLGTTGTLLGTAKYLKKHLPNIKIGGVIRANNNAIPGVRTKKGLSEVSFDWKSVLTERPHVVGRKQSYAASLALIRHGLMVGPSAGFAFEGVLGYLRAFEKNGTLHTLSGKHVVFICPDTPYPYIDDYFATLDIDNFPTIKNEHLLVNNNAPIALPVPEITVDELANSVMQKTTIVDVREPSDFLDHHIPSAVNIPLTALPSWIKSYSNTKPVVFVCGRGIRSRRATHLARQMDIDAYSLAGGTEEWSLQKLPLTKPDICVTS